MRTFADFKLTEIPKNERSALIKELFEIYTKEGVKRKRTNWKKYIGWLKENRTPDSKERQKLFKKTKLFIKEINIKSFCFKLSHIPTKDLYYVLHQMRDRFHTSNASAWLFGSLKNLDK